MSTSGGLFVHVGMQHGLLIRQSEGQEVADSTDRMPSNG